MRTAAEESGPQDFKFSSTVGGHHFGLPRGRRYVSRHKRSGRLHSGPPLATRGQNVHAGGQRYWRTFAAKIS